MSRNLIVRLVPVLDFGGVESRIVLQSELYDRSSFDLRIVTLSKFGRAARRVEENGVPVDCLDVDPSVRNPKATLALASYLRRHSPAILHASISEGIFHGAIAGNLARTPRIVLEEVGVPNRSKMGQRAFGALYQVVNRIVAVADVTKHILAEEGAPKDRLVTIHNCASPEFFPNVPRPIEARASLNIVAIGRLVDVKNHQLLIRAFSSVVEQFPKARLTIVGDGPLQGTLMKLVQKLGLETAVSLPGFQSNVREILTENDLFVLPSKTEGCSISLIEAMATGINVMGSTADGIAELLGPLDGRYMAPSDQEVAWSEAMIDFGKMSPAEREARAMLTQTRAYKHFSPNAYIANVENLYNDLLELE